MRNECSIVQDLLPLYLEKMVQEDTASFVKAHLERCPRCRAKFQELQADELVQEPPAAGQEGEAAQAFLKIRNGIRRRILTAAAVTAVGVAIILGLLYYFPVYHILQVQGTAYYSADEVAMLAYIGSREDRAAAQTVLRQADVAFADRSHTWEENQELYGPLARYATSSDRDAAFTTHSLNLWSAHLDNTEGYLWVFYSSKALDEQGSTISESKNIPSLWYVKKDETGQWRVVSVKEHP